MMWRMMAMVLIFGCGEFSESNVQRDPEELEAQVIEKSRDCEREKIACEQECFRSHGTTLGTLNPLFNRCVNTCSNGYELCQKEPYRIDGRPGYTSEVTYSWQQPPSDGFGGYYGYCGPTAASNLLANICGIMVSPEEIADACFGLGPGTTPDDLAEALNGIEGCGTWAVCQSEDDRGDLLQTLQEQAPVAVLLDWQGILQMHWVTVVNVDHSEGKCHVVFNHRGGQDRMECTQFLDLWSLTPSVMGKASVATGVLKPFTYICEDKDERSVHR